MNFDELPIEIIHNIVHHVIDASPRTYRSLKLSSKSLRDAVNVVSNRRKSVTVDSQGVICQPSNFDISAFETAHYLTVETPSAAAAKIVDATSIVNLVQGIKHLKTFTWNVGYVPREVLVALNKNHPYCSLRIFEWRRPDDQLHHLADSEFTLATFPTLTHFRYAVGQNRNPMAGQSDFPYAWQTFQQIVKTSQSLQLASFVSKTPAKAVPIADWETKEIGSTEGMITKSEAQQADPQALKHLTIDYPNFPLSLPKLQELAKSIDLAKLESLKFTRGRTGKDYFQNAATILPGLKNIVLNLSQSADEDLLSSAGEYLRTCPPVRTLSLWGWTSVITVKELVNRHGESLEVLQLHEREDDILEEKRKVMSPSDFKHLRSSCPRLNDLTIDLNSENDKFDIQTEPGNLEILGTLASGEPRLRKLGIYFDCDELQTLLGNLLQDNRASIPQSQNGWAPPMLEEKQFAEVRRRHIKPIVEPYVLEIWKHVFGQDSFGERLLNVKFGNWETKVNNNRWDAMQEPRTFCEVKPHERDDRIGECTIKTKLWSAFFANGI